MFSFLIFLFRTSGIKELRHGYGNYFKSAIESYLISAMLKFLTQQLRGALITVFEMHFTVEDLTDMNQHRC